METWTLCSASSSVFAFHWRCQHLLLKSCWFHPVTIKEGYNWCGNPAPLTTPAELRYNLWVMLHTWMTVCLESKLCVCQVWALHFRCLTSLFDTSWSLKRSSLICLLIVPPAGGEAILRGAETRTLSSRRHRVLLHSTLASTQGGGTLHTSPGTQQFWARITRGIDRV